MIIYWDYLKLDSLLKLQTGIDSGEDELLDDEVHFILVHQVFELWFKLILREIRIARDLLHIKEAPEHHVHSAVERMKRASDALLIGSQHWQLLNRLSTQRFLDFRDKLFPASGFQSFQFAEVEILLGLEDALIEGGKTRRHLNHIRTAADKSPTGNDVWLRIESARKEVSLRKAVSDWLHGLPIRGSTPDSPGDANLVRSFITQYLDGIHAYYEDQIGRLSQSPNADAASFRRKFDEKLRVAKDFLFCSDLPESERQYTQRVRAALLLIETYVDRADLHYARELVRAALQLEESLLRWRFNHVRVVELIIGRRIGTGGSAGVDYLEQTMTARIFGDIWAVKTEILPTRLAPPLDQ